MRHLVHKVFVRPAFREHGSGEPGREGVSVGGAGEPSEVGGEAVTCAVQVSDTSDGDVARRKHDNVLLRGWMHMAVGCCVMMQIWSSQGLNYCFTALL